MRYAWDLYNQYLNDSNLKGIKGWYAKKVLSKIRVWDVINTNRVDYIIANSNYIAKRIKKVYRRDAIVIYPPVNTEAYALERVKEGNWIRRPLKNAVIENNDYLLIQRDRVIENEGDIWKFVPNGKIIDSVAQGEWETCPQKELDKMNIVS